MNMLLKKQVYLLINFCLAYLDSLLACLVHLTAKLRWSGGISDIKPLVSSLRELLDAFHKGKGASASFSVMGLSIIRHSMLILNHLLAELQHSKFKVKNGRI